MTDTSVIVERASGRVGRIVEELAASSIRVQWPDGDVEVVRLGARAIRAVVGSARYLQFTEPERLSALLTEEPHKIFLLAMADTSMTKLTSKALQELVTGYGFDSTLVEDAWARAKPKFEDYPGVAKSKEARPAYRLTSNERFSVEVAVPEHIAAPIPTTAITTGHKESGPTLLPKSEREDQTAPVSGLEKAVIALIAAVSAGEEVPRDIVDSVSGKPLASSLIAASIPSSALREALAHRDHPLSIVVTILAASAEIVGRGSKVKREDSWPDSDLARHALSAALAEVGKASQPDRPALKASLSVFAGWFSCEQLDDPTLFSLTSALAGMGDVKSQNVRVSVLDEIARRIRAAQLNADTLSEAKLKDLAESTSDLPFALRGGRSAFIAALAVLMPEAAGEPMWWRGLDVAALRAAGDGALQGPLRNDRVANGIVKPMLDDAIRRASNRPELMELLGTASSAALVLDSETVTGAIWRVAKSDPALLAWVERLSEKEAKEEALNRVAAAENAVKEASRERETALKLLTHERERSEKLATQLRDLQQAERLNSARQSHHEQLDAMRTLANVANLIEAEAGALPPDELNSRLKSFLRREGIEVEGLAGDSARFNPELHEAPGSRPLLGEDVIVVRSGYKWITKDEDFILVKPKVIQQKTE